MYSNKMTLCVYVYACVHVCVCMYVYVCMYVFASYVCVLISKNQKVVSPEGRGRGGLYNTLN